MNDSDDILADLKRRFGDSAIGEQPAADGVPTVWVEPAKVHDVLAHLRLAVPGPFEMLYDLTGIDERLREHRPAQAVGDFTVVYDLLSLKRNADVRVKTSLPGPSDASDPFDEKHAVATVTDLWPGANWYERELWDMFGVAVRGHPGLRRLLMPPWWRGHPLRKDHHARATEMGPFEMSDDTAAQWDEMLRFSPEDVGWRRRGRDFDYMFLNVGPHHPGTHGLLRVVLQLKGQSIVDAWCDIGYHHRGAEKMGERQSWHTYIPYTDRVDYLGGVMNNFPYVLAVERLAAIDVPDRAKVIRIMLAELFRIISHLVFYGTLVQDLGAMSPVFYMFTDRERALDIIEAITGARMHPGWFRIGGVAQDLPAGWDAMVRGFLDYLPRRLDEYDRMVMRNSIFRVRTKGIGQVGADEAVAWGATGPVLRATGLAWDFRRMRPYGGYDQFEFDIPTGSRGDCHDRAAVHVQEMRQSLRIIRQCLDNMPAGDYKSRHPLATPPIKDRTMRDIETLIHHFLSVSWGPVIPPGEASARVEAAKGANSYYLVSDGSTSSYRTRIRAPSFAHVQMVPLLCRGGEIPDLAAVLGSIDYVLADVDR